MRCHSSLSYIVKEEIHGDCMSERLLFIFVHFSPWITCIVLIESEYQGSLSRTLSYGVCPKVRRSYTVHHCENEFRFFNPKIIRIFVIPKIRRQEYELRFVNPNVKKKKEERSTQTQFWNYESKSLSLLQRRGLYNDILR